MFGVCVGPLGKGARARMGLEGRSFCFFDRLFWPFSVVSFSPSVPSTSFSFFLFFLLRRGWWCCSDGDW